MTDIRVMLADAIHERILPRAEGPENIDLTLKKAKLSQAAVSIKTDDGEVLHGTVEELDEHTLKLSQENGVMFVPIVEIDDVLFV